MKKGFLKLFFLSIILFLSSLPTFAEMSVHVDEAAVFDNIKFLCSPRSIRVRVSFHPSENCLTQVHIWAENNGRWFDLGDIIRPADTLMFQNTFDVFNLNLSGKVTLRASYDARAATVRPDCPLPPPNHAETEVYFNNARSGYPTFAEFKFINTKMKPPAADGYVQSPAVAHFESVSDDVPWDRVNKMVHQVAILGGETQRSFNNNFQMLLPEGRHRYYANVIDGCGIACEMRTGEIIVDNTPPTLSINKPSENQLFASTDSIDVEILFGDTISPIRSLDLFVDRVGGTPYKKFTGPQVIGLGNRDIVNINIIEGGSHRLYVVAEDMAGNKTQAARVIQIQVPPSLIQPLNKMQKTIKQ